jgi:prepilin-type N-terminal cleavage/methylation domain-containing protein
MIALLRRARFAESGFTLVELLMAVTILGIIVTPLGAAFFVALRTVDETSNRRASSHDAQLLSIYLPPDVQNASDAITTGFTASTCTGVTASTIKLQLVASSNDTDYIDATDFNVVYFVQQTGTGSTATYELIRKTCVGTITSTVVGENLGATSPVAITRTPTSGTPLLRIAMQVTGATTPRDTTPYIFTVTARTRTCATTPCNA